MTVRDPLMRPVTAHYLVHDGIAVIEMAQASGLTLLSPEERNLESHELRYGTAGGGCCPTGLP